MIEKNFTKVNKTINLKVIEFKQTFSRKDNEQGQVIFASTEDLVRFGRNIIRQFDKIVHEYGIDYYQETWNYEFPTQELVRLRYAIKLLKVN